MNNKFQYILFLCFTFPVFLYSQTSDTSKSSLNIPVDIPVYLAGNFGELRSGHLHAGIDIKTNGRSGYKINAIQDGYVSRIKISEGGYGKALYINHPQQDLTSVYAHLQSFPEEIEKYILDNQYRRKSYEIELFPEKNKFKVKKGDLIGFTGNSGSSKGPHLHFEIRSQHNQHPINPLKRGINIEDNIAPKIFQAALYPESNKSTINNSTEKLILNTKKSSGNKYKLHGEDTIELHGPISFGIKTNDFINGSNNWCGVYEIELLIDDVSIYNHTIDEFSFQNTRYINAIIDYEEKIKNNNTVQKLSLLPNNRLNIYKNVKNKGIYNFTTNNIHDIIYKVTDEKGNTSSLSFKVKGSSQPPVKLKDSATNTYDAILPYNQNNEFEKEDIKIAFPVNAFYDTVYFQYNKIESSNHIFFSDIHRLHKPYIPVHKNFSLSIKTKPLNSYLKNKVFIARIDEENNYDYKGGDFRNGTITTQIREFGDYAVLADTISPVIEPLNNINKITNKQKISFKIKDELSGIKTYNGYIDGEWVLFEYDPKNDIIYHDLDKSPVKLNNKHELELYVSDNQDNIATYYTEFEIQQ
ncbi:MAG: M23 family metallopeptidase [Bacteroidales bacterium]